MSKNLQTNCRSEEGITVGLIDALISISRILAHRPIHDPAVQEALKDLAGDEDLAKILYNAKYIAARAKELEKYESKNPYSGL